MKQARDTFERILSLNPNDIQGVRFCWEDVRCERSWEEMAQHEEQERAELLRKVRDARGSVAGR